MLANGWKPPLLSVYLMLAKADIMLANG